MPLSSRRDMSVSISPWCLWRCAHRGGGGAGEEIEGMCYSFVHHSVSPVCVPSPTPLLISWGRCGECNQGMRGDIWTCLQGNKGMDDWQCLQPSSATFCWASPSSLFFHLYLSAVQWLRSLRFAGAIRSALAQHLFIFRPSRPQDRTRTAEPPLSCFADIFCILKGSTLKFWHCLAWRQFSKTHLIGSEVELQTF